MNRVTRYSGLSSSVRACHVKSLVGVVQCRATTDIEANYEQNKSYIQECVNRGASLVCLPEYFAYMNHPAVPNSWSEPLSGPTLVRYCKIALDNQCWLSLGGF
jgi:predicted amidohydrolase